jgi:hypothetical protein
MWGPASRSRWAAGSRGAAVGVPQLVRLVAPGRWFFRTSCRIPALGPAERPAARPYEAAARPALATGFRKLVAPTRRGRQFHRTSCRNPVVSLALMCGPPVSRPPRRRGNRPSRAARFRQQVSRSRAAARVRRTSCRQRAASRARGPREWSVGSPNCWDPRPTGQAQQQPASDRSAGPSPSPVRAPVSPRPRSRRGAPSPTGEGRRRRPSSPARGAWSSNAKQVDADRPAGCRPARRGRPGSARRWWPAELSRLVGVG